MKKKSQHSTLVGDTIASRQSPRQKEEPPDTADRKINYGTYLVTKGYKILCKY